MDQFPEPPKHCRGPRIFLPTLDACHAHSSETSVPFEYGTRLTEFAILGNLAQHAGLGHKVQWDGPNMK